MKKSLYFLFILALFCLTGCKDALVPKPIKLTCNINTFDAPISCISRSTADADKLYIGQEDGCIIEKVNNNCQTYSINSNRRIYDILEYSEDSLFVGTRDAGLKLLAKSSQQTQTYYIKNKRMNYSVYSMTLDDDKQCLYVGTSNGLFRLNLKDGSTSHELTPIQLGKCSKNCGVNMLLLWICGHTLNLMSAIGLIVTCGIIINDSILKLDAINELRRAGMPLLEAIHEAGRRRLRPIIMTSLTTIFAMVPLLFSFDMGSELQKPLSIAMIGAMFVGTLVSLFIIPLIYWFIYRKERA